MTTRLPGYSVTIPIASDTYILPAVDPQARGGRVVVSLVRNGGYDGTVTLQSRPAGSSAPFQVWYYTSKAGVNPSTAAFTTGNDQFKLDATGLEIALVTTGATVGTLSVSLGVENEA